MRSADDLYSDLEADRRSREEEMLIFERLIPSASEGDRESLKRSLVLLIYAHVEGFCKFSLLTYVEWLNAAKLTCAEASYPLAAATLSKVFAALRDPRSKHQFFKNVLPDDGFLHLSAREQEFIERVEIVTTAPLIIPDSVIDTKSNVTPAVLMKLLFQMGMDYEGVKRHASALNMLIGVRNAIAHGDRLKVPKDQQLLQFKELALDVMSFLQEEVFGAVKGAKYLRQQEVRVA